MPEPKKLALTGRSHIEVFYTKGHTHVPLPPTLDPLQGLVAALDKAKTSIAFGIFSFTSPDISDAFMRAQKRGVAIRGVADANETSSPTSKIAALRAAGFDIKLVGTQYALMHLKVAVIDAKRSAFGSYNWTTTAERSNDEMLTVITNLQLATVLSGQIDAIRTASP